MRTVALLLMLASALADEPSSWQELTPEVDRSVSKATEWLLSAQRRSGAWGLDRTGQDPDDVSCTSIAALALMAGGNTERGGPDGRAVEAVQRAAMFVLARARAARDGAGDMMLGGQQSLIQTKLGYNIHTFFATTFLSQALGMQYLTTEQEEEVRHLLRRMTDRIAKTQEADGSWHRNTFGSLKATCMAWLALRSSSSAGIQVDGASMEKTVKFIRSQYVAATRLFGAEGGGYQTIYATASSVRVLHGVGEGKDDKIVSARKAFFAYVRDGGQMGGQFLSVEGEDYLAAAMMTQALSQQGGDEWREWFTWIRKRLIDKQGGDGSWTGTACISGRTFATSCALLTLQAPNRLLPLQDL
ncbi:MAG: hypothetical protein AAB434_11825 [Planctomycetota bacterium]